MAVSTICGIMMVLLACGAVPGHASEQQEMYVKDGRLCQDQNYTFKEMEYDEQIHCRIAMEQTCQGGQEEAESEDEDDFYMDESCHTMYKKECEIRYRPRMRKVRVKVCPGDTSPQPDDHEHNGEEPEQLQKERSRGPAVLDVRPVNTLDERRSPCVNGKRKWCIKKYETECRTEYRKHQMLEDHPRCALKLVEQCDGGQEQEEKGCRRVPAMRCQIEKRQVTKTMPETKCTRVPREFCRKIACPKEQQCYTRNKVVNEIVPEENCQYRPHRVCHPVRKSRSRRVRLLRRRRRRRRAARASGHRRCRMAPAQKCERMKVNPRPVSRQMRKIVCRDPRPEDQDLMRQLLDRDQQQQEPSTGNQP